MTAILSRPQRSIGRRDHLGPVRVHERLAIGGAIRTGAGIHLGWLEREERVVALRRLHPRHVADEVGMARLRDEARVAMRVVHPNVVATLGMARHHGEVLFAMEYVPGASLAEIAEAAPGGLEPSIASAIAGGVLRGLHASHEARGLVGPGVSPASVLVGEDGRARVIGFDAPGPATADAAAARLPYASPEQLLRRGVDARRDVYAASVMLWETLTGLPLFRAATVEGTLQRILSGVVPAPSRCAVWVGAELDAIVLRGLARDPADRFASAAAMANALEQASCASARAGAVARALAGMDLGCIRGRRSLVDRVHRREGKVLHIECTRSATND
jgi:serine/threonine protein kinase